MSHNAEHIHANLDACGVEFVYEPISKGKGSDKVQLRDNAPRLHIMEIDLAREAFGDSAIMFGVNNTSWDVKCEGVVREMIVKNRKVTNAELERACIDSLLGARANGRQAPSIVLPDGTRWVGDRDSVAIGAAVIAGYVDVGVPVEVAQGLAAAYVKGLGL
jgi:hypothetical protein